MMKPSFVFSRSICRKFHHVPKRRQRCESVVDVSSERRCGFHFTRCSSRWWNQHSRFFSVTRSLSSAASAADDALETEDDPVVVDPKQSLGRRMSLQEWSLDRLANMASQQERWNEELSHTSLDISRRLERQLQVLQTLERHLERLRADPTIRSTTRTTNTASHNHSHTTSGRLKRPFWWTFRDEQELRHEFDIAMRNLQDLQRLHFDTSRQSRQAHELWKKNRQDMSESPPPLAMKSLQRTCREIQARHALTVEPMAELVIGVLRWVEQDGDDDDDDEHVVDTLHEFLRARASVQLLCDHVTAMDKKDGGAVSGHADLFSVAEASSSEAGHLVEAHFLTRPSVHFVQAWNGNGEEPHDIQNKSTATLIRPWLQYALVELVKNCMAATIEHPNARCVGQVDVADMEEANDDETLMTKGHCPIFIAIDETPTDARIRILDQGGGLPKIYHGTEDLFQFATHSAKKYDRMDDQQTYAQVRSPMRGLGVGLAMSRMQMRAFGGDVLLEDRNVDDVKVGLRDNHQRLQWYPLQRGMTATILIPKDTNIPMFHNVTRQTDAFTKVPQPRPGTRPFSTDTKSHDANNLIPRQEYILSSLQGVLSPTTEFSTNPYELERHGRGESYHPTQRPDIIVAPSTVEDVAAILQFANSEANPIPVIPFGAGTSVEGHLCALEGGISLDMRQFQTIVLPGDDDEMSGENDDTVMPDPIATVGAGVTRKQLNEALRHTGLQFVVDPGADATLGGMTATGASGTTAVRYGTMRENLLGIECVLPDGTIAKTGTKALKSSAGYDLVGLLCGSEGTLGVITSVTVKLHPIPEHVVAAVCVFETLTDAASTVAMLKFCEIPVVRCELLDASSVKAFNAMVSSDSSSNTPKMQVKPTLFLEFQASSEESLQDQVRMTESITHDFGGSDFEFTAGEEERKALWAARHNLYYASINLRKGATDAVLTDACVPLSKFAEVIAATVQDVEDMGVVGPCFGHAGDGNFHCILPIMADDSEEYIANVHKVNDNLIQRTLAVGGTCTGEHGVGYGKIKYLEQQYGHGAVRMMESIKKSLDPSGIMNPGKVVQRSESSMHPNGQRRSFSTMDSATLTRRSRLLDACRGYTEENRHDRRPLPAFPLESKHFGDHLLLSDRNNNTPHDFHQTLCDLIRSAKKRVSLASLYIGPAASPDNQPEEVELLQALSDVASKRKGIPIKVVLDHNRGLRPVPMSNKGTTTSSAKAVAKVINGNVHLFQVLPKPLDSLLPNPLNEVAGVFHIKAYIVDDDLILSGANLSQEYFCDRQDRYLWIRNGGNGLVDFYADVVELLCQHSYTYALDASKDKELLTTSKMSRKEFLQAISRHFQDAAPLPARSLLSKENTAAVGIPTFFAPESFLGGVNPNFVTDTEASLNLLKEGADHHDSLQLSSAYLNPTADMMQLLQRFGKVQLLTAGPMSHGFKPKDKAGNKGKAWIPAVFDHLAEDGLKMLSSPTATLHHWERDGWTFHAKGIWLREASNDKDQPVAAAIVGSSNFGERSFVRDMESNLVLVFPPEGNDSDSTVSKSFGKDWDDLLEYSNEVIDPKADSAALPWYIRLSFPFIKTFF